MLCAVRSGRVTVDGIEHLVRAGATWWSSDLPEFSDPAVAAFFGAPEGSSRAVSRSAGEEVRVGGECRLLERPSARSVQAVSPSRGAVRVKFTAHARRELIRIVGSYEDGREAAGALFGVRDGDLILIDDVGTPSMYAERTANSTELLHAHALALEESLIGGGYDSRWLGDWHTHGSQDEPSRTDFRGWASLAERLPWVGVIASPDPSDPEWPFARPTLRAWVTTPGGRCRQIRIEE